MIDHIIGRPSNRHRKYEVFAVIIFWSSVLGLGDKNGPAFLRKYFTALSRRLTPWQTIISTMMVLYFSRNFAKVTGLESPEPLANLYTKSYFRATWVTTALDAGFWTAMPIRQKWLRDLCGPMFSIFYLFATELADEKQRKCRATITTEHMRVSWNKMRNPYLLMGTKFLCPPLGITPRHIKIARPKESPNSEPIDCVLYWKGSRQELLNAKKVILDFPGGGFVAMSPRCHDDKLCAWARKLPYPIISVDYKKAPEYPYPYALNECYDVYHSIVYTNGKCVGLSGEVRPRIALVGDSAGGNFAVGVTLMILNTVGTNARYRAQEMKSLPLPDGLVLVYPSLDMNIGSWMSEEQMSLIRDRQTRRTNRGVIRRKSEYFEQTAGLHPSKTPANATSATEDSDSEGASPGALANRLDSNRTIVPSGTVKPTTNPPPTSKSAAETRQAAVTGPAAESTNRPVVQTRLATTSRISYFNDRILTPEMMRAMVILYVGPDNRPDFTTDFLLSPVVAPVELLEMFPKCYFLTGERDPLVDDTVIFAGRVRRAKEDVWKRKKEMGTLRAAQQGTCGYAGVSSEVFDSKQHVEVSLIPGISHGFLQMCALFPGAWVQIDKCAKWLGEILADEPKPPTTFERTVKPSINAAESGEFPNGGDYFSIKSRSGSKAANGGFEPPTPKSRTTSMSEDERPLEIGMARIIEREKKARAAAKRAATKGRKGAFGSNGQPLSVATEVEGEDDGAFEITISSPEEENMLGRSKSLMSLGSDDDLVSRRMEGMTRSLGGEDAAET